MAQTPDAPPQVKDPLGRETPQQAALHFLEACHARDYSKAARFLDLRRLPSTAAAKTGSDVAHQLEDLLDDMPFDIASLSRQPEGDQTEDLPDNFEHLIKLKVHDKTLDLQLERVELKPGLKVWLVSSGSVALIPLAHQLVAESPLERRLPRVLVESEFFDTPIWRWLALLAMGAVIWPVAGAIAWGVTKALRSMAEADRLRGPVWTCLVAAGMWVALEWDPPATLARLFVNRFVGLVFVLGLAWICAVVIDMILARWQARLDPRVQAVSFSVLPLGRQVLKLTLFLVAILTVVSGGVSTPRPYWPDLAWAV